MTENEVQKPIEEKILQFYDDELVAVRLADGAIYVPVRRLCDNLGLSWPGQRERVNRDEVLSEGLRSVRITRTDLSKYAPDDSDMLCLPLDLVPGWLFGVQTSRVREELRPKLRRYRRECFKVLWDAFKADILPAMDPALSPERRDLTPAEQALALAEAIYHMAKQQVEFERQLIEHGARLDVLDTRLERAGEVFAEAVHKMQALELRVYGPNQVVSEAQAAEIASAVAAVAHALTKRDPQGKNQYQSIWGELHRRYKVTTYTRIPAARFGEVIGWLEGWLASIPQGEDQEPGA